MEPSIRSIGERAQVPAPRRDRRAKRDDHEPFPRELLAAGEGHEPAGESEYSIPRPRAVDRPVAPAAADEAGFRVDVEA